MNGYCKGYNYKRARKNGAKFSLISLLTTLRSRLVHSEYMFSQRYKYVSFSCTNADGAKCCRFKMITYSHPERWDSDVVTADDAKEDYRIDLACRVADVTRQELSKWLMVAKDGDLLYGPDAIQYDLMGTCLSYISHLDFYPSHPVKKRCCEAVANIIIASDGWFSQVIDPEKASPDDLQLAVKRCFK